MGTWSLVTGVDDRRLDLRSLRIISPTSTGPWAGPTRTGAVDRQQPRLGTGPCRAPEVVEETIPGLPIGLAYFGQINPSIFEMPGRTLPMVPPTPATGDDRSHCGAENISRSRGPRPC